MVKHRPQGAIFGGKYQILMEQRWLILMLRFSFESILDEDMICREVNNGFVTPSYTSLNTGHWKFSSNNAASLLTIVFLIFSFASFFSNVIRLRYLLDSYSDKSIKFIIHVGMLWRHIGKTRGLRLRLKSYMEI